MDLINQKPGVFLLTTKLDLKLSLKIDKRYLGVWVNGANIKDEKNNIQKFHWEDKDKKNKDYNYIISLYEKLLKKLSQRLNENLGIKKSERYWRIVLGPWLTYYLVVNLDRWETLDKCFETESKFIVTEFEQAKNSLECVDTFEFSKKSEQSDFFNHALFLRILKFQYGDKIKTIKLNEKNLSLNDTYYEKTFHHIKKNNKKNFIFEMISSLALKYNKIIFDDFNFPKINFIKLNSRFFSIPVKLGKFFSNYNFKKIKREIDRKNIFKNLIEEKNSFEKYINTYIGLDLPQSLFEANLIVNKEIQKFVKKRLIYSMYSFIHDDLFKIWLAESIEAGSRLVIAEHGGGLDSLLDLDRKHYSDIADKFAKFTATSFSKKDIQMCPIMSVVKENFDNTQGENCTIIDLDTAKYTVKIINNAYASEKQKIIKDHIIFTNNLRKEILKKVKFRIAGNHMGFGKVIEKKFGLSSISLKKISDVDTSSSIFLKKFKNDIFDEFRKSKIIVCSYPLTPFFEAMVSGIPTILFCRYKYWEMKKESKEMFDILKKSQIVFEDPLEASEHINKFWNNPSEWWLNKKTVEGRMFYLENFYNLKKNWEEDWFDFIFDQYNQLFPVSAN